MIILYHDFYYQINASDLHKVHIAVIPERDPSDYLWECWVYGLWKDPLERATLLKRA
jgi:hypothetical protein